MQETLYSNCRCLYEKSGKCLVKGGMSCILKTYGTTSHHSRFSPNALCPRFIGIWRYA